MCLLCMMVCNSDGWEMTAQGGDVLGLCSLIRRLLGLIFSIHSITIKVVIFGPTKHVRSRQYHL